MKFIRLILWPFSFVYSIVLWIRNTLYDKGIFSSEQGAIPTIVVGNLNLGGTGKTPHTLAILHHLSQKGIEVALLSRGYGRKTKGFRLITENDDAASVGDEPLLMKKQLPHLTMAVCENRLMGIKELKTQFPHLQWVVLDDALQHRPLRGHINILLTEFKKPFFNDFLVPSGNLRDHKIRAKAADIIIATKSPDSLQKHEMMSWKSNSRALDRIPVLFSSIHYGQPQHVFVGKALDFSPEESMAVTGIARPEAFIDYTTLQYNLKKIKTYPDHHPFTVNDMAVIQREFDTFTRPSKAIFTTEKDAVKMADLSEFKQLPIYFIPISVKVKSVDDVNWLEMLEQLMKEKIN